MEENNHEQLEKILHSITQDAKPDKNFEQMLKVKLRERFHEKYETQRAPFFKRIWKFKIQLISALLLVSLTSTTIYAYSSDNVTNGHILYPLKRSTENIEGLLATTPQAKTKYYNKMAKRRMRELAILQQKGITDENTLKETDTLLAKATTVAQEVPDEADESANDQSNEEEITPLKPVIQNSGGINLAEDKTSIPTAVIRTSHRKTKREKVLEEVSQTRDEFENKFSKKHPRKDK